MALHNQFIIALYHIYRMQHDLYHNRKEETSSQGDYIKYINRSALTT